jgi:two-component system, NtrC family, sensor kinase
MGTFSDGHLFGFYFPPMSIRTKVIGCFTVILFLFLVVSVFDYFRFRQANERLLLVNELYLPFSRSVFQLQSNIYALSEDTRRIYFRSDDSTETSTFSRLVRDLYPYFIQKKLTSMEHLLSKQEGSEAKPMVQELTPLLGRVRETFAKLISMTDRVPFELVYKDLRFQLQAISRKVDYECQRVTRAAQNEGNGNLLTSVVLSTFVVLFGVLILLLSHRVLEPLPQLIHSLKKISDGDFDQSLKVSASNKDEVSLLTREYNRMLEAMRERDRKIQTVQKELLQSERLAAVGQLSAEVVHEIRNPLNAISLNIDWLGAELGAKDDEITKTLESIAREIERLNQITESYLARSKAPFAEPPKTEVHDLLQEILAFSKEEDKARNILVDLQRSPEEIYVKTDRSRLKQAFLNVIKNAKEAMPRGGRILVKTELTENISRVSFSDSGHGMNDSTRRLTFQPFFSTKPNGTGIGLMVTKNIIEEANGTIHCESQMGQGTTFTFQFPV